MTATACATFACGSVAGDGAGKKGGGTTEPGACPPTALCDSTDVPNAGGLTGSYELVFANVDRSDGKTSSPSVPLPAERASIDVRARLDITSTPTGALEVALTSRWGRRAVLTVASLDSAALVVTGKALFGASIESNEWQKLRLPRNTQGGLAGTFTANGELTASAGDVLETYPISGNGKIGRDTTPPEVRIAAPRRSRGGLRLPWDEVQVDLAEPLAADKLYPALTSALPELGWPPMGDAEAKPDDIVTGYYGKATSFGLGGATRTITMPSGVVDPSSNALVPFVGSVAFRDVGAPLASHDFDASQSGATWGAVTRATDARCESGGCLVLASSRQNECVEAQGIAGRLALGKPISKVHARVRILASDNSGSTTSKPLVLQPIRLEVASPTGSLVFGSAPMTTMTFERTGEDALLPWSTPWITVDADPLSGTNEVGFHLIRPICDSLGGLPYPDVTIGVIVDSVWAE